MQAVVVVIPHVATELLAKVSHRLKLPAVHEVGFERVKKRLHVRVLAGRAATRHALTDPARDQPLPEWRSQILAAAITVKDEPDRGTAPAERRIDHRPRQVRVTGGPEPPGQ